MHSQNYLCEVMVLENLKNLFTVLWLCLSISINIIFVKMVWLKKERIMHVVACNNGLFYF